MNRSGLFSRHTQRGVAFQKALRILGENKPPRAVPETETVRSVIGVFVAGEANDIVKRFLDPESSRSLILGNTHQSRR